MKYTGKLYKDMGKYAPIIPRIIAEHFPFSCRLLLRFHWLYKHNETWGKQFVKSINGNDGGRDFMYAFFDHWIHGHAAWMNGQGRETPLK